MNDIQKMFQTIINNQSAFRQEILGRFDRLEKKLTDEVVRLEGLISELRVALTERIDKIGKQQAYLEDDSPTREEFETLEKRVNKLERKRHSGLSAN